jgi:hypothetical protein
MLRDRSWLQSLDRKLLRDLWHLKGQLRRSPWWLPAALPAL